MEFRLLGPVEVRAAGQVLDAGQPRQRRVLAALLIEAGRLVTYETLVDRVWGDRPPGRPRRALYGCVARLRRLLSVAHRADSAGAESRLVRRTGGYLLDVDPEQVDLHRFRRLDELARDPARSDAERVTLLRQARELWRGEPLAGLSGRWAERVRQSWRQPYLNLVVDWAQAESQVGNAAAAIPPLTDLTGEHPLAEPPAVALIRALAAAGHTADALRAYTELRARLREHLGVAPGPEAQALHRAILRGT